MASASQLALLAGITAIAGHAALYVEEPGEGPLGPQAWGIVAVCVHLACVVLRGWPAMGTWEKRQFLWGVFSCVCFLNFLQYDPDFKVRQERGGSRAPSRRTAATRAAAPLCAAAAWAAARPAAHALVTRAWASRRSITAYLCRARPRPPWVATRYDPWRTPPPSSGRTQRGPAATP